MNWSTLEVADVPPEVVTDTFTVPLPEGEVAVSDVGLLTLTSVAEVEPNSTVASLAKPVPVSLTDVPPVGRPVSGLTLVTVGAAAAPE